MTETNPEIYYKAAREKCQDSLFQHIKIGMGYDFVPDCMQDLTAWFQFKWNPKAPTKRNVLIQASRDSFKSVCITQAFPSWALSQNPNLAILIVSKVFNNAKNFLAVQRKRFESREFIKIFGNWRSRNWSDEALTISGRTRPRKEPSIMVAGVTTEITGFHFDIILGDDIVTKSDMYSSAERKSSARLVQNLWDLSDKRKGLTTFIGSCWHLDDELQKIKKGNKQKIKDGLLPFDVYERPAERFKDGAWEICWPFFTRQILDQIRADKADVRDYTANYRLKPLPPESQIFSKFHYFDFEIDKIKVNLDYIVIFCDPSLKDTKKADYSAIVVLGRMLSGRIYVLDADIQQRKPTLTIEALISSFKKWGGLELPANKNNPNGPKERVDVSMYMETVMFQEYLKDQTINEALQEGVYLPLAGYPQKSNKISRITGLEKYTTSGQVLFRKDWEGLLGGYDILMNQLTNFPNDDHDDGPDALEGGVSTIILSSSLMVARVA